MKAKRVLLVILLCVLVLVALLLTTTAASASPGPRAQFGIQTRGECLVRWGGWGVPFADPADLGLASGFLVSHGQGLFTEGTWKDGEAAYVLDPTSQKVSGEVKAAWTRDGVTYEFQARLYATTYTDTFFRTNEPVLFVGHTDEPWASLSYSGIFAVGANRSHVEGYCALVAMPWKGDNSEVMLVFNIPGSVISDSEEEQQFGLFWAREAGLIGLFGTEEYVCPAPEAFDYWVNVR